MEQQAEKLHEWLALGRQNGTIRDARTSIYAYCLDERRARVLVAGIVQQSILERDALAALEHAFKDEDIPVAYPS